MSGLHLTNGAEAPNPDRPHSAHLSREELEAAVEYWQPRAMRLAVELDLMRAERRRTRGLTFWRRLRYIVRGKA